MCVEREATKHIAPAELVTDENSKSKFAGSILPPDVEARHIENILRELAGLDLCEAQRVREFIDTPVADSFGPHIPKLRSTLAMLVHQVHVARSVAQDRQEIADRLHREIDEISGLLHGKMAEVRQQLVDATAELAISRKEFAAEVQRSQNLQHRLMQSSEAALQTINNLVDRLP